MLNFAVWRDCLQKALFAPPSPMVAVTTSLSLAAYLSQSSRGFLAILIPVSARNAWCMHNSVLVTWFLSCTIFFHVLFSGARTGTCACTHSVCMVRSSTRYVKASRFKFFFTCDHEPRFGAHTRKKKERKRNDCIYIFSLTAKASSTKKTPSCKWLIGNWFTFSSTTESC